jgi:hypothetical protein
LRSNPGTVSLLFQLTRVNKKDFGNAIQYETFFVPVIYVPEYLKLPLSLLHHIDIGLSYTLCRENRLESQLRALAILTDEFLSFPSLSDSEVQ